MKHKEGLESISASCSSEKKPKISENEFKEAREILRTLITSDFQAAWVKKVLKQREDKRINSISQLITRLIDICGLISLENHEHNELLRLLLRFIGTVADKKSQTLIFEPLKLLNQEKNPSIIESIRNNLLQLLTDKTTLLLNMAYQQTNSLESKRKDIRTKKDRNSLSNLSIQALLASHIFQPSDTLTTEVYRDKFTYFRRLSKLVINGNDTATTQDEKDEKKTNIRSNATSPCHLCILVSDHVIRFYWLFWN